MKTEKATARLDVMRTTYDGFEIAEKDLALRGPGDFFSSNKDNNFRQSGGFGFHFATMCDDRKLFEAAFGCAKAIALQDPRLALPEHELLKAELENMISINSSSIS
jgi:ATP-dependent DNA helicase RecG